LHLNPGSLGQISKSLEKEKEEIRKQLGNIKQDLVREASKNLEEAYKENKFTIKKQYPPIPLKGLTVHGENIILTATKVIPNPVVTSTTGDIHMVGSKHYEGNAVDFRLPPNYRKVARDLQEALGNDYDVVLESDHIHVEYDPQKTNNYASPLEAEGVDLG